MRAAGVDRFGAEIRLLDLPEPSPGPGEVLLGVRACGVGNWDEFVRTGGWDTGVQPPMALGVEAAGVGAPNSIVSTAEQVAGHQVTGRRRDLLGRRIRKLSGAGERQRPEPAEGEASRKGLAKADWSRLTRAAIWLRPTYAGK